MRNVNEIKIRNTRGDLLRIRVSGDIHYIDNKYDWHSCILSFNS